MKITIIHGQSHKGSTYHIARMLAEKLDGEITEFFLPRDFNSSGADALESASPHEIFCRGCTQCFMVSEQRCPHYEQLKPLTDAMDDADVLILASPVYVYHVTGAMKVFLDHYGYRWMVHRPVAKMFHKQAVCISTAAGGGMKHANQDMADSTFFWGVAKTYRIGTAVRAVSWAQVTDNTRAKLERKTDQIAAQIKQRQEHLKPGIKTRILFNIMRLAQKKGLNPADAEYWKKQGWTERKRPWK